MYEEDCVTALEALLNLLSVYCPFVKLLVSCKPPLQLDICFSSVVCRGLCIAALLPTGMQNRVLNEYVSMYLLYPQCRYMILFKQVHVFCRAEMTYIDIQLLNLQMMREVVRPIFKRHSHLGICMNHKPLFKKNERLGQ